MVRKRFTTTIFVAAELDPGQRRPYRAEAADCQNAAETGERLLSRVETEAPSVHDPVSRRGPITDSGHGQ